MEECPTSLMIWMMYISKRSGINLRTGLVFRRKDGDRNSKPMQPRTQKAWSNKIVNLLRQTLKYYTNKERRTIKIRAMMNTNLEYNDSTRKEFSQRFVDFLADTDESFRNQIMIPINEQVGLFNWAIDFHWKPYGGFFSRYILWQCYWFCKDLFHHN